MSGMLGGVVGWVGMSGTLGGVVGCVGISGTPGGVVGMVGTSVTGGVVGMVGMVGTSGRPGMVGSGRPDISTGPRTGPVGSGSWGTCGTMSGFGMGPVGSGIRGMVGIPSGFGIFVTPSGTVKPGPVGPWPGRSICPDTWFCSRKPISETDTRSCARAAGAHTERIDRIVNFFHAMVMEPSRTPIRMSPSGGIEWMDQDPPPLPRPECCPFRQRERR